MADLVLGKGRKFAECLLVAGGNKYWIIAKSAVSAWCQGDAAAAFSLGGISDPAGLVREGHYTDESGIAGTIGKFFEFIQKQTHFFSKGQISPAIACGQHSRPAVECGDHKA